MLAWPSGDVINWPPGPSQFHLIGLISQRLAKAINTIPESHSTMFCPEALNSSPPPFLFMHNIIFFSFLST
ncbi:Uncharacterized protein APZ42_010938 [Daphnia magna]|uniref:Uncharacterized protein n=1 Tax=Daphnia magna TaxID=35525 RepID=A0A162TAH5_9CRUS|nr:Uncharacterized protein APZ42_010938 [Daphnia magna]